MPYLIYKYISGKSFYSENYAITFYEPYHSFISRTLDGNLLSKKKLMYLFI